MQTKFGVSFDATLVSGGLDAVLSATSCADAVVNVNEWILYDRRNIDVTIEMPDGDPRIPKLLKILQAHRIGTLHWRKDIYTEDELQSAQLLIMGRFSIHFVFGGARFKEMTYDLTNACPNCESGAQQTSPLFIEAASIKKFKNTPVNATDYGDLFVKEKILTRLRDAGIGDFLVQDVYSLRKDGSTTLLPRKQIIANHIMPPMHPSSLLDRHNLCKTCHRAGFLSQSHYPLRFAYRAKDIANIADFNLTWENFGEAKFNSKMSLRRFASPYMLITPKVMNILRPKDGEDPFQWIPIRVVEH